MKAELVNPFVSGAFSVLRSFCSEEPTRGDLAIEKRGATSCQVNVAVGVTGSVSGHVVLGMSLRTADALASAMIGQQVKTFDALAASAIAELANMISGSALAKLAEAGVVCDLTPPTVIRGNHVQIDAVAIPALVIPIVCTYGELSITIMLTGTK